jgi:Cu+-exporting ATPase
VRSFRETAGCGLEANVAGHELLLGAAGWLRERGVVVNVSVSHSAGSTVHLAIDGVYRGHFVLTGALRPAADRLTGELAGREVALLSGDNERERALLAAALGPEAELRFEQSPLDKLNFIKARQAAGRVVMMVGDGLNDAGALKQSNAGVAVVEKVTAFSPASDVILTAEMVSRLGEVLGYSRQSVRVVRAAFVVSAAYNLIGVGIAASGRLSPVVCAILMPLSSVSVVAFACGATNWLGRKLMKPEAQP